MQFTKAHLYGPTPYSYRLRFLEASDRKTSHVESKRPGPSQCSQELSCWPTNTASSIYKHKLTNNFTSPHLHTLTKSMYRPYLCRNPVGSTVADFSRRHKSHRGNNLMLHCETCITLGYSHQESERRVCRSEPRNSQTFREAFPPAFMGSRWAVAARGKEKAVK
jgi:hypothetical protein